MNFLTPRLTTAESQQQQQQQQSRTPTSPFVSQSLADGVAQRVNSRTTPLFVVPLPTPPTNVSIHTPANISTSSAADVAGATATDARREPVQNKFSLSRIQDSAALRIVVIALIALVISIVVCLALKSPLILKKGKFSFLKTLAVGAASSILVVGAPLLFQINVEPDA